MPSGKKDKPPEENAKSNGDTPNSRPATRNEVKKSGNLKTPEDLQEIKNAREGRKFLEKLSLLCPPCEPATHEALAICLHQIAAIAGVPKQALNAIRSAAFMLEEMEEDAINLVVKEAFDSQMTEFTSDMKALIEDAKEKIDVHLRIKPELIPLPPSPLRPSTPLPSSAAATPTPSLSYNPPAVNSYAATLIRPPPPREPKISRKRRNKSSSIPS